MATDLKWMDACQASQAFTKDEQDDGWPAAMKPDQLAALQRPLRAVGSEDLQRQKTLFAALMQSCALWELKSSKKSIAHTLRVVNAPTAVELAKALGGLSGALNVEDSALSGLLGKFALEDTAMSAFSVRPLPFFNPPPPRVTRGGGIDKKSLQPAHGILHPIRIMVAAADFAAWLDVQGEEPSVHVLHWFAARGVVQSVSSPFPLADWRALVRYRRDFTDAGERGPDWGLGNQLQIANEELERRMAAVMTKTAAGDAMGRELGYLGDAPHKQLLDALKRDRKKAKEKTSTPPEAGYESTRVKDGKRTA